MTVCYGLFLCYFPCFRISQVLQYMDILLNASLPFFLYIITEVQQYKEMSMLLLLFRIIEMQQHMEILVMRISNFKPCITG